MQRRIHKQRGDTIVEVLLSVAIISTVLAGAFGVSQRSTLAVRSSQEHAEAKSLLQGQVEAINAIAATTAAGTSIFNTSYFCFSSNGTLVSTSFPGGFNANTSPLSDFPSSCVQGAGSLYHLAGKYTAGVSPEDSTFIVTARWEGVTGSTAKETMVYRTYPQT